MIENKENKNQGIVLPRTRGIRNNNPGNIKLTKTRWVGQIDGNDKVFVTFDCLQHGIRAMFLLLFNSYLLKGYDTIEKIINRYAPSCENCTSNYISYVCNLTHISREQRIAPTAVTSLVRIVAAIICFENGCTNKYNDLLVYITKERIINSISILNNYVEKEKVPDFLRPQQESYNSGIEA